MKKSKKNNILNLLKILLITILIFIIAYYIYNMYDNIEISNEYTSKKLSVSTDYEQTVDNVQIKNKNIADIMEEVSQCVCGISKLKSKDNSVLSLTTENNLGLGTGIIVSSNGYILSNSHVTGEKYSTCYVTIEDGETYTGTVVWSSYDLDLSITKISANNLKYVSLGDSSNVRVGETVYAIGNPIGYEFRKTVTSGIVSAINRTIKIEEENSTSYMSNLIQTDATINPGNSGGPLIYSNGEVIGINSVKITSAEGIGFAIPINVVKPIIDSFVKNGNFNEATLGLSVYDESVAKYLNLENKTDSGIYIAKITKNGPSYGSGLKDGDIITKIDDKNLKTINDLKEYIYGKQPGDTVKLTVVRGRINKEFNIILGKF